MPYIFWPWFAVSCFVLLRRRISHGRWRPMPDTASATDDAPSFPSLPEHLPEPSMIDRPPETWHRADPVPEAPDGDAVAHAPAATTVDTTEPDRPRARSLAEAVDGITMPCDLTPLTGEGTIDPREVAFHTHGVHPATVGSSLADELERLGYAITPLDDRSIRARRGPDEIEARLWSTEIVSSDVMRERHPSAPEGALVVELKLT